MILSFFTFKISKCP